MFRKIGCFRRSRKLESHRHASIRRRGKLFKFPILDARETVLAEPFLRAEPRKDDWHAPADWVIRIKPAALAQEKKVRFAMFFKMSHMRAVQVNAPGAPP